MRNLLLLFGIIACWMTSSAQNSNDAGVSSVEDLSEICPGTYPVRAVIRNYGTNQISSLTVNWSVDGVIQPSFSYTSLLDTTGGTGSLSDTVTIGNYSFTASPITREYDFKIWVSEPNGNTDPANNNDTLFAALALPALHEAPVNIDVPFSGITLNSAEVYFDEVSPAVYSVIYGPSGFDPDTGGTELTNVVSPFSITGLQLGTDYDIYMYVGCGSSPVLYTDTTGPVSFHTLCSSQSLPFIENFDTRMGCFQSIDGGSAKKTYRQATPKGYYTQTFAHVPANALGGNINGTPYVSMILPGGSAGTDYEETLLSPPIDASGITSAETFLVLEFDQKYRGASLRPGKGVVEVYDGSQWHEVYSISNVNNNSVDHKVIDITDFANADFQFRFVYTKEDADGYTGWWMIDNVSLTEQACLDPQVIDFTALGANSVTVQLNENGGISRFDYEVDSTITTIGMGNGITGNVSNPGVISGLNPNTPYHLYVRADCDTNGNSAWIGPIGFRTSCVQPMSGTYTLDRNLPRSTTNFTSFAELEKELNYCGVSGPVTVNVAQGTYNEQIHLHNIPGMGAANSITIQGDPANTAPAILSYAAETANDNYVIKLDTVEYFTVRNLGIIATGITHGYVIDISEGYNKHILIEQDSIHTKPFAPSPNQYTTSPFYGIYGERLAQYGPNFDITIRKNVIIGGFEGIFYQDRNAADAGMGLIIDSNEVRDWYRCGIHTAHIEHGATISGNTILGDHTDPQYPLYLERTSRYMRVIGNHIKVTSSGPFFPLYAINIENSHGLEVIGNQVYAVSTAGMGVKGLHLRYSERQGVDTSMRNLIANNMFVVEGGPSSAGAHLNGVAHADFVHNSIHITGMFGQGYGLDMVSDGFIFNSFDCKIYNNNIVNNAGGAALFLSETDPGLIDYNNYYTTGNILFRSGNSSFSDLASWQAGTDWYDWDLNSISADPAFISDTDLHATSPALDNRGTFFPGVTEDIDGEARMLLVTDMGADEFKITEGECTFFTDYRTDTVIDTEITLNWNPGSGSSSYYLEYGPKGYVYGSNAKTDSVVGTYPSDNPPLTVSDLDPDTEYDFYLTEYCNSGSDSSYFSLPWPVKTTISCFQIRRPELVYISHDSAAYSFTVPGDNDTRYDYEYGPSGFEQGTGTVVFVGNPGGIGGLSPATYYDVYIRTDCTDSSKGRSGWYGPLTFRTACDIGMSGTYTIGGIPGPRNFVSFENMAELMNYCGVSGPVVINVAPGRYEEHFHLHNVSGTSAINTVIIQPDPAYTSRPILEYVDEDGDDSRNYVIKLDTVSYITVKGLIISAQSSNFGYGIDISGGFNHHLTFEGNTILTAPLHTTPSSDYAGIYADFDGYDRNGYNRKITIRKNEISGGHYGIYFRVGRSTWDGESYGSSGLVIDSNIVKDWYEYGVHVVGMDTVHILNNTITTEGVTGMWPAGGSAIRTLSCDSLEVSYNTVDVKNWQMSNHYIGIEESSEGIRVMGNRVHAVTTSNNEYGLYINEIEGLRNRRNLVANNMVSVETEGTSYGMGLSSSSYTDVVHNSVNVSGNYSFGSLSVSALGNGNNNFYNNNLVNKAGGPALYYFFGDVETDKNYFDYNNYYTEGENLVVYSNTYLADLAAWQNISRMDSNTVSGDPYFLNSVDLYALGSITDNKGKPVNNVTTDIDDTLRSATTPDIGANEYTALNCLPPSSDLNAVNIYSDSVQISWRSGIGSSAFVEYGLPGFAFGDETLISGVTDTSYMITGLLPRTTYEIYIRDYCSAGDTAPRIGPLTITTACENRLSGIYTIDPSLPRSTSNYTSFSEAVDELNACGVSGPVVFKVAYSKYDEQIKFEGINGTSATNTVSFIGDTSSGKLPVLTYRGGRDDNFVILFSNTSHVLFESLKITSQGTFYGNVVDFQPGGNDHITFRNDSIITVDQANNWGNRRFAGFYSLNPYAPNNHITIKNNMISAGHGVYMDGGNFRGKRLVVDSNYVINWYSHGIYAGNMDSTLITNNTINVSGKYDASFPLDVSSSHYSRIAGNSIDAEGFSSAYGVRISNSNGVDVVKNNVKVTSNSGGMGLYYYNSNRFSGERASVVNNMIAVNSKDGSPYGIYIGNSSMTNYVYNSVNVTGNNSPSSTALYISSGSEENVFYNNSISNSMGGYAMFAEDTAGIDSSDYNNYYTTGDVLVHYGDAFFGTDLADLSAWKNVVGTDTHSLSSDPLYMAGDNLHIHGVSVLDDAAMPFPNIDVDIDGDTRSATTPDIGADEYQALSVDMAIAGIVLPVDSSCGDSNTVFSIVVQNIGTDKASNFIVDALIFHGTSTSMLSYHYTDTLNYKEVDTVHMSPFNTSRGGGYAVEGNIRFSSDVYTENNNWLTDAVYLHNSQVISPRAVNGYFCGDGAFDILYVEKGNREIYWLSSDSVVLGNNDSLVVGPLSSADTTFYLGIADNVCNIPMQSISLEQKEEVTADFNYTMGQATAINLKVDFDGASTSGATSFSWNFGDGNIGTGTSTDHIYTANGSYDVELVVSGDCGTDTITKTVVIAGIDIVENTLSSSLKVYPNPTSGEVNISFRTESSDAVEVRLMDLSGKVIYSEKAEDINGRYDGKLSLEHFAKGVYLLTIESGEMKAVSRIVRD